MREKFNHMDNVLFKQSTVNDPYEIYANRLAASPVWRDDDQQVWGIYSHEHCLQLLTDGDTHIPSLPVLPAGTFNDYALTLMEHHVRLSNGTAHSSTRAIAMGLYHARHPFSVADLLEGLLLRKDQRNEIDWVKEVGKQLPLGCLLQEFQFPAADREIVMAAIEDLIKIMVPDKTAPQIEAINAVAAEVYRLTERHILTTPSLYGIATTVSGISPDTALAMTVANLMGLMIQSYDAGRGILSNTLLQALHHHQPASQYPIDKYIMPLVMETLRYDPPVHHTRRIMTSNLVLHDKELKKGDTAILVLAAANRDANRFERPHVFDAFRKNNHEHLTYGAGAHRCMANHGTVHLATEALRFLLQQYPHTKLLTTTVTYEPLMNVRLPRELRIALS